MLLNMYLFQKKYAICILVKYIVGYNKEHASVRISDLGYGAGAGYIWYDARALALDVCLGHRAGRHTRPRDRGGRRGARSQSRRASASGRAGMWVDNVGESSGAMRRQELDS